MSWNELRAQWQSTPLAARTKETSSVNALQAEALRVRRTVARRDWLESIVAALLLPLIGFWAWQAFTVQNWPSLGFTLLLGGWAAYVPFHLWRARRHLPRSRPDQPLIHYLVQHHAALQRQARMLESVWRWYLLPPLVALSGMVLAQRGLAPGALALVAIYVGGAIGIHVMNVHAARTVFRKQATDIDRQLRILRDDT